MSKSGIPVAKRGGTDSEGPMNGSESYRDHHSHSVSTKPKSKTEPTGTGGGPLAKAMTKKPKKKKNDMPETWADEKIQSQSMRLRNMNLPDYQKRREDIEKQLKEAEAELASMKDLMEKREKMLSEAREEAQGRASMLEQQLNDSEQLLIENGIDPLTGEQRVPNEEGKQKVEAKRKFTKKRVQEMKEKLQKMNLQTESYLADIENTMQYLSSLEDASLNSGPLSEETKELIQKGGSEENFIAQVYSENVAQRQDPTGSDSPGDSDEEEDDKEGGDEAAFFITRGAVEGADLTNDVASVPNDAVEDKNEDVDTVGD